MEMQDYSTGEMLHMLQMKAKQQTASESNWKIIGI